MGMKSIAKLLVILCSLLLLQCFIIQHIYIFLPTATFSALSNKNHYECSSAQERYGFKKKTQF